jgi:hypothetical protein
MADQPTTVDELAAFISETLAAQHDYESSAQALHDITAAAFNVAASELGNTGFQASWAALRLLSTVNGYDGPYAVLKAEDMVFPQYPTPVERAAALEREWLPWAADRAREKLADDGGVAPAASVREHWELLDRENPPAPAAGQKERRDVDA